LDSAKWYSTTHKEIICAKGGRAVLSYYNGSHTTALMEVYPELVLNKEKFFQSKGIMVWKTPDQRRKFFDDFAKSKQFNPLDAEKWYITTLRDITSAGGRGVLKYYEGSHVKALIKLYPELMLKHEHFFQSRLLRFPQNS